MVDGRRKRKCKYESITIKQANHKNSSEDAQLRTVQQVMESERQRYLDEIEKQRKAIEKDLNKFRRASVPLLDVTQKQVERKEYIKDVCIHLATCYMSHQDKKKATGQYQPIRTPEHMFFIQDTFEIIADADETDLVRVENKNRRNIYEYGRASHDMQCASVRGKPVDGYEHSVPLNFRRWERDRSEASGEGYKQGTATEREYIKLPPIIHKSKRDPKLDKQFIREKGRLEEIMEKGKQFLKPVSKANKFKLRCVLPVMVATSNRS